MLERLRNSNRLNYYGIKATRLQASCLKKNWRKEENCNSLQRDNLIFFKQESIPVLKVSLFLIFKKSHRKFQKHHFRSSRNKHWPLRLPESWKLHTNHLLWSSHIDPDKILGNFTGNWSWTVGSSKEVGIAANFHRLIKGVHSVEIVKKKIQIQIQE